MGKTAQWTWLVYMAGDNNLQGSGGDDLAEMKQAGSTADVNIIVQFDTEENETTRYRVEKNNLKVVQKLPGVNCGDPRVLTQFIKWGIKNYPAQHYLLDVWNHGGGWENLPADYDYNALRALKPKAAAKINRFRRAIFRTTIKKIHKWPVNLRAIAIDVHSQDYLDNQELRNGVFKALPKNRKLDILGCDACLMNMLEVAYEMKDTADFMVGSEETEPVTGWPYDTILKGLVKKPRISSHDLAKLIAASYGQCYKKTQEAVTQSALDLGKIQITAMAVSQLADALIAGLTNAAGPKKTADGINLARGYSQKFEMPEYLDLGDFARQISLELPQNAAVRAAAAKILDSLKNASGGNLIIQNSTCGETMKKATGISIYFPEMKDYSKDYRDLAFCKEYHWKDFLETFFVKSGGLG